MDIAEFEIMDGGNQIEAQGKAFTPISVAFTQNAKDFQTPNDILDQNAFLG